MKIWLNHYLLWSNEWINFVGLKYLETLTRKNWNKKTIIQRYISFSSVYSDFISCNVFQDQLAVMNGWYSNSFEIIIQQVAYEIKTIITMLNVFDVIVEFMYSVSFVFWISFTNFYSTDFTNVHEIYSILWFDSSALERELDNSKSTTVLNNNESFYWIHLLKKTVSKKKYYLSVILKIKRLRMDWGWRR